MNVSRLDSWWNSIGGQVAFAKEGRHRLTGAYIAALAFLIGSCSLLSAENYALSGTAILGTKDQLNSGPEGETPFSNSGVPAHINDGDLNTRVDTYNGSNDDDASYVGIVWDQPLIVPVAHLDLTFALFSDGGWFGHLNGGPSHGEMLADSHLVEPRVEVSDDGGMTWRQVAHTSDYFLRLRGASIGGRFFPDPHTASATFSLTQPLAGITGLRLIGEEGGAGSNGFLGVFELAVRDAGVDSDNDGMEDSWETVHNLDLEVDDSKLDADHDGLTNLAEYKSKTNPREADTDYDMLNDGAEVAQHLTYPGRADSDADGLLDGEEVNHYLTSPLNKDSDKDDFSDYVEVHEGSNPLNSSSLPNNIASSGRGIMGVKDSLEGGVESEIYVYHSGGFANINDGNINSRVDTFTGQGAVSFVGVVWDEPQTNPIVSLELALALFNNGGWFGMNGSDPGEGSLMSSDYLIEPRVEITEDGVTWSRIAHTSTYIKDITGKAIGGGAFANPNRAFTRFTLPERPVNMRGIRVIGSDGGVGNGGFLGVFELKAHTLGNPDLQPAKLTDIVHSGNNVRFLFITQPRTIHVVEFKDAWTDPEWKTLATVTGTGLQAEVNDNTQNGNKVHRFYRITSH
ncbi:MAG: hypothetical protein ACO1QB_01130 [Verrucomicrobiales bacterium]